MGGPSDSGWRARRALVTLGLTAALAAAAFAVTVAGNRFDAHRRREPPERVLYLPRGDSLKYMCLGYDGLASDLVWIRCGIYAGKKMHSRDQKYEWLAKLCGVTTDLDPHWIRPYCTGALLLSALPQDDELAMGLLRKGLAANGANYEILLLASQISLVRGRRADSVRYLREIADCLPDRADVARTIIADISIEGGDYRRALAESARALAAIGDPTFREVTARSYREALARFLAWDLSQAAAAYAQRYGRPPGRLEDLLTPAAIDLLGTVHLAPLIGPEPAADAVRRLPADPLGLDFELLPDGRVRSRGVERLEAFRAMMALNGQLTAMAKARGRPARSVDELIPYVEDLARRGELRPGAAQLFGNPPRLPSCPLEGKKWGDFPFAGGVMGLPPPGPDVREMFSAPLLLPAPEAAGG